MIKMKQDGFRAFLKERKLDDETIDAAVNIIDEFDHFLRNQKKSIKQASYEDLYNFSESLIETEKNTFENYVALLRFGHFQKNKEVIIASLEILDGSEMIVNFSNRLIEEFGEPLRNEVFKGIGVPPLGIRPRQKVGFTKKLVERFLAKVDYETSKAFFEVGLRDKYPRSYEQPIELFREVNDFDEFCRRSHQNLVKTLETHQQEGTLFFTQEVDDEVISYVKRNPTIETGVREGNRVTITKIPYLAKKFIHESQARKKRYYFCHNPWIRHALLKEDHPIDPVFCGCSAGYFKNFWEAILNQPVKVEVVKSVIRGDPICEFAFNLPPNYL
ncbi:MAG: hypothetical protein ACFFD8_01755 [Candidatus Thorarchaeota archaeon]